MEVRVQINGLTRPEDAEAALAAGADAFGLYFWRTSTSAVTIPKAKEILSVLPGDALTIGMFAGAVARTVERTMDQTGVKLALFAGTEDPEYCSRFSGRYVKVIRIKSMASLEAIEQYDCPFYVLDGDPAVHAGVREIPFDLVHARRAKRMGNVVISGGLTPETVKDAVRACRPWGVEVSSGVESAQGVKNPTKLRKFIEACKTA